MIAYLNDSVISILTGDVSVTPRWGEGKGSLLIVFPLINDFWWTSNLLLECL